MTSVSVGNLMMAYPFPGKMGNAKIEGQIISYKNILIKKRVLNLHAFFYKKVVYKKRKLY